MATPIEECKPDTFPKPGAELPEFDDAAAAGDWALYRRRCEFVRANPVISARDALALKRRFGLAYLGTRAQLRGGVYMRLRPSVFTPVYVERMASENAGRRFARYPWLEQLIALWQQLDHEQYGIAPQQGNITMNRQPRKRLQVVPSNVA